MRKLILAAVFTMGATSASLAAGGGAYDGSVVANAYEYLAAHGCPRAGFGLTNCGYDRPVSTYSYTREARRDGNKTGDGTSVGWSR